MMPGGLTMSRQAKEHLNKSIFSDNLFDGKVNTIRIDNGTGMIVKFDTPDPSTLVFNSDECVYTDKQVQNGVQVCIRQLNNSLLV
ncbi:hypothetical protein QBC38DRAFT_504132, partial [Podospora fimiseda]